MKKIKISNNANPNFIGAWNIGNKKLCDNIIDYFENNKSLQVKGESQSGVDINLKKTTDISISPKDLSLNSNIIFKEYISELFKCYKDYVDTWPFLKKINSVDIGKFVIVNQWCQYICQPLYNFWYCLQLVLLQVPIQMLAKALESSYL